VVPQPYQSNRNNVTFRRFVQCSRIITLSKRQLQTIAFEVID
jgi:hypothetical protein